MFVAEINGQGIVAFSQPSPDDAPGWTDDEEFRSVQVTTEKMAL